MLRDSESTDERLLPKRRTPEVSYLCAKHGASSPYRTAARYVREITGLPRLSHATVRSETTSCSERIEDEQFHVGGVSKTGGEILPGCERKIDSFQRLEGAAMKITIHALVERANGERETIEVYQFEPAPDAAPSSGLGLFLTDSRTLSANLQQLVLREQAAEVIAAMSRCEACSQTLSVKDSKTIVYRTALGKARLASPRLYSRCAGCGALASHGNSFSPMALALPERTHPRWLWLQTRYASIMSYGMARKYLAHGFTGAADLPWSSVRANVQDIGERLETEVRQRISKIVEVFPGYHGPAPDASDARHALQVDAGYVRSVPSEGSNWISVIASKVVRPESTRTHSHAYSIGYDPQQGVRQQALLATVGIDHETPITVLCDGGEDVDAAGRLLSPCKRILDWFHIGMRFEHVLLAVRGLKGLDVYEQERLSRHLEGAKRLLWHGQAERCLERLASLRKDTGWIGKGNALGKLIGYLQGSKSWLVNYAERRANCLPISSAGAESAVDHVVGQRLKRNGHMRWTRKGAHNLLQVRCAVLNGQDVRNFKRWYPAEASVVRAA